jgi:transcriptional regulator with XRE-family HTH domain
MPRRTRGHEDDEELRERDIAIVVARLAPNVRKLRIAARLTQERLAEEAGIDVSYVQRLERGVPANVTIAIVGALARALGADVSKLLRATRPVIRNVGRPRAARKPR